MIDQPMSLPRASVPGTRPGCPAGSRSLRGCSSGWSSRQSYRGFCASMIRGGWLDTGSPRRIRIAMRAALLPLQLRLVEAAADDAQAQLVLEEAVDGGVRGGPEALEGLVLVVRHSAHVPHEQGQQDERARGQARPPGGSISSKDRSLSHVKRHAIGESARTPVATRFWSRIARAATPRSPPTMLVVSGRSCRMSSTRPGRSEVSRPTKVALPPEAFGRQGAAVHPRVDHRGVEGTGDPDTSTTNRPAGDPTGATRSGCHFARRLQQELDERFLHVRLRVARHAEGDLVEIDAPRPSPAARVASNAVEWVVNGGVPRCRRN